MKNLLFKALAIIMGIVMSSSLVACGSDDDDQPTYTTPSKEVVSYDITYLAEVTDGYLDYYDVTLSYVYANGTNKTEPLTEKKSFNISIAAKAIPSEANFTIHANLKNPLPEYNEETTCQFGYTCQMVVNRVYSDKSTELAGGNIIPNSHNITVKGENLTKYFEKYSNFDIAKQTVEIK